jgi:hypothetical protein
VKSSDRWSVVGLCLAWLPLAACAKPPVEEEVQSRAVKVEQIEGSDLSRVTVTEEAAKRLDLQTEPLRTASVRGSQRKVMPYASLLYDREGNTWAYTTTAEPLTFVRAPVTVDYIDGEVAVLSAGPPAGTAVVTVGAQELYGSEEEFEEE